MSQSPKNTKFSISVIILLVIILAATLVPQLLAGAFNNLANNNANGFLNREYSYSYRGTGSSTYTSKGVLVANENQILVFAIDMPNGKTHYKSISATSLVSMHTIDDTK